MGSPLLVRWDFHLLLHPWLCLLLTLSIGPWGPQILALGLSQALCKSRDETQPLPGLETGLLHGSGTRPHVAWSWLPEHGTPACRPIAVGEVCETGQFRKWRGKSDLRVGVGP